MTRSAALIGLILLAATPALASVVPVPEPSTTALIGAAVLAGVLYHRARKR